MVIIFHETIMVVDCVIGRRNKISLAMARDITCIVMVGLCRLINYIMNSIGECGDSWLASLISLAVHVNWLTAIIITAADRSRGRRKGDAFLGFHTVHEWAGS